MMYDYTHSSWCGISGTIGGTTTVNVTTAGQAYFRKVYGITPKKTKINWKKVLENE